MMELSPTPLDEFHYSLHLLRICKCNSTHAIASNPHASLIAVNRKHAAESVASDTK